MTTTRAKLLGAAADALREEGVAAISARTVAARAGVNQALVFYHFSTVSGLLREATIASVDEAVADYRDRFARVASLSELLTVGRELHEREQARGNVAQMAQVLAGAQHDAVLADAAAYAMATWSAEVETVLRRVLAAGPLRDAVDPAALARAVTAAFVGLELLGGVDPGAATLALGALDSLGTLVGLVDRLGPLASRAVRSRLA